MTTNNMQRSIDFLLENAGPAIQYRLRKEILKNINPIEEENWLEQIYQTPHFLRLLTYVKQSGYIGIGMHSWVKFKETYMQDGEAAARLLSYYAIPKGHQLIVNFIAAMRDAEVLRQEFSYFYPETVRFTERYMGQHNGTGLMVLMYTMQAMLGYGDDDDVRPFQNISLETFTRLLPLTSLDEITAIKSFRKKKFHFLAANQYYPCVYHLTTLAYTHAWRNLETLEVMANAINHLDGILNKNYNYSIESETKYNGAFWPLFRPFKHFDVNTPDSILYRRVITEIAMLGVGCRAEVIRRSMENVEEALAADGILRFNYAKPADKRKYIPQWTTAYVDVALEPDYKKKTALDCDMTFWAVQFLHYVNESKI